MHVRKFSPCLVVDDVSATARFYATHFALTPTSNVGWFASLAAADGSWEVSFLQRGHDFLPSDRRDAGVAGLVLGFIVDDAASEERRLRDAGVEIAVALVDEPYGQRHFLARDPNGVTIDVIQLIAPDPAWMAQFDRHA